MNNETPASMARFKKIIKALDREHAIDVLLEVARHGATFSTVRDDLDLNPSTVNRCLDVLVDAGLVTRGDKPRLGVTVSLDTTPMGLYIVSLATDIDNGWLS